MDRRWRTIATATAVLPASVSVAVTNSPNGTFDPIST
jgi:hypothetical protein